MSAVGKTNVLLPLRAALLTLCLFHSGRAQEPSAPSKKELAQLIKTAKTAADYRQLSRYFHYREVFYQSKAQAVLDDYAFSSARFTMVTKTVPRADVVNRTYKDLVRKQKESAAAAAEYDARLLSMGVKPDSPARNSISVEDLKTEMPAVK